MFTELILAFKKIVDDVEYKKNSEPERDERARLTQLRNRAEAATLVNNQTHLEPAPLCVQREEPLTAREAAPEVKPVPHLWQELSVHSALKLIDNVHTPADVLLALAGHLSTEVRSQLIDNPSLPMEAIMLLLKDDDPDVRYSLAESYHLDRAILETLTADENPYISARAETTVRRLGGGNFVHEGVFGSGDVIPLRARV